MRQYLPAIMLLLSAAAAGQTLPAAKSSDAATIAKANGYAKAHGIRGTATEVSVLGGTWRRVVLVHNDQDPSYPMKVLMVNDAGRVAEKGEELKILAELLAPAKDAAGYEAQFRLFLKMERALPTLVLKGTKDIPDYDRRPLPKDLESVIREPWTYVENGATQWVFYTYQQIGGVVERWTVTFDKAGYITRSEELQLSSAVGAAIFLE